MTSHGAPTKRRRWPFVIGGLAAVVLIAIACGSNNQSASTGGTSAPVASAPASSSASSDDDQITYELTGSGSVTNITYSTNGTGAQKQITTATKLPWKVTVPAASGFGVYTLVAQRGSSGGTTSCKISKGSEVINENESEGAYAVVTCNGS